MVNPLSYKEYNETQRISANSIVVVERRLAMPSAAIMISSKAETPKCPVCNGEQRLILAAPCCGGKMCGFCTIFHLQRLGEWGQLPAVREIESPGDEVPGGAFGLEHWKRDHHFQREPEWTAQDPERLQVFHYKVSQSREHYDGQTELRVGHDSEQSSCLVVMNRKSWSMPTTRPST